MPKSKVKEGKKRRRGKNENDIMKRELVKKDGDDQAYAQVEKILGNSQLTAFCFDGKNRLCHIRRGKLRKNGWINTGDIILIRFRGYQHDKGVADVILKYTPDEARILKNWGHLPESTKLNDEVDEEQNEGEMEFRLRRRLEFAQTEEISDGQVCGCATTVEASEIWVCNDVWMDILPSFDHAQLGLKLALLSPRFDALVDKHFYGKTEFTIWKPIEIRKNKEPEPKLYVQMGRKFVPFPLPDRPLPSKIRFKRLEINYIDHSVIAFLRANHQTFKKRGTNLGLLLPTSDDTDGPPIWDFFVREIWPIFSPNIHHLVFNDDDGHLDNLRRLTSPTILTDLNQLVSIDSYELLPAAIGDDFDVQNATISAGQALTKWLLTPRKDGQPKRLLCQDYSEQADFDWVNIFKEHFLRATISSVGYQIHFFVPVPSIQMVPFELVNEWTKEKLTFAIANENEWYNCWIMNRCKFGEEAVAVQQQKIINFDMAEQQQRKLDEKWINNCNDVSFWLDIGTNCIGPLSAPPSAEEDEKAGQCITKGASSADNE
ncbi:hypothetical protein niasHS_017318 [Heterodera schachtii]|uniref:S1-like domain-containing protein n=1 Tax=Heterodera schachtii TaxID=97005 RepID=A0ABD2HP75_HETSC